jgi:hypothetical protein
MANRGMMGLPSDFARCANSPARVVSEDDRPRLPHIRKLESTDVVYGVVDPEGS